MRRAPARRRPGASKPSGAAAPNSTVSQPCSARVSLALLATDGSGSIMKEYDAVLLSHPAYADRTSYVIAPDGKIIYSYTAMDPDKHVANTMAAVQKWQEAHAKG